MLTINLLPWREQLRETKQRYFFQILTVVLLITLILFLVMHQYFQYRTEYYQQRVTVIKKQLTEINVAVNNVAQLATQINQLNNWLEYIKTIHLQSSQRVYMLNKLAIDIKQVDIKLIEVNCLSNQLIITGLANTKNNLLNYIKKFNDMEKSQHSALTEIKNIEVDGKLIYSFALKTDLI